MKRKLSIVFALTLFVLLSSGMILIGKGSVGNPKNT
ncbi:hypothetical protein Belba_2029 [Belliella baltica DSM 15883]|uniref:Uncharacterized protein n=1 Tax=Belliella baltica (strain DSM 15883 / CIP 108006 / LMG 21964 / BA134) TaxID=866536 RepID=I3Z5T4_BELBD|nr:hypothetical protein Belba_2029 [Belliella baltica DSM 15883]